ncbi:MAG: tRNA (adenosine(37)-N6)-threonylcarbamoyltransferase complex transferase subunit TsaD, partial [Trichodesmium sp. St16_bin4-tuft]|nr:tRNA (adenosine(37)-N6)-threonylcarbamoyltransferase complex transferase subunit TsaD [Trichodesmium sp. St16_bin4-tuft]
LRLVQKIEQEGNELLSGSSVTKDIAASFQETVAKGLTKRAIACALDYSLNTIAIGGGVAANSSLRQHLSRAVESHNLQVLFPSLRFCTDNAAMIGCVRLVGH